MTRKKPPEWRERRDTDSMFRKRPSAGNVIVAPLKANVGRLARWMASALASRRFVHHRHDGGKPLLYLAVQGLCSTTATDPLWTLTRSISHQDQASENAKVCRRIGS